MKDNTNDMREGDIRALCERVLNDRETLLQCGFYLKQLPSLAECYLALLDENQKMMGANAEKSTVIVLTSTGDQLQDAIYALKEIIEDQDSAYVIAKEALAKLGERT